MDTEGDYKSGSARGQEWKVVQERRGGWKLHVHVQGQKPRGDSTGPGNQ